MSNLLDKLTKEGSLLSGLDGKKPLEYDGQTDQISSLKQSTLDLDGKTPLTYSGQTKLITLLSDPKVVLDLNGKKPITYKDTAPEGQSGRI